jgi:hypothetical protein
VTDEITKFSETLTSVHFDDIIELGKSLGIISYDRDMDNIHWDDFPDSADGKIGPLGNTVHFWYFIEFTDHSLSNDHIQSSIDDARAQAIRTKPSIFAADRKRLLIICQHDDDAVLVDRKINENFSHESDEQSNNPHVFVIRWSDVKAAHRKKKICSCGKGNHRIKECRGNYCCDCCDRYCNSLGKRACRRQTVGEQIQSDYAHRSDYG